MSKKQNSEENPLTVFFADHDRQCAQCSRNIEKKSLVFINQDNVSICLSCAGLNELVILPSGNTALTVRSKKTSKMTAVILKYSQSRKRYERQGILVEEKALHQAMRECEADAEKRAIQRGKSAVRREKLDQEYQEKFAARIRQLFPHCPTRKEYEIAGHACEKYSGRVGRSSDAKALNDQYVRLAVIAHIRHSETNYDSLLSGSHTKREAREQIRDSVEDVLKCWEHGNTSSIHRISRSDD